MIRCKHCGQPVGVGDPVGGDLIACADCIIITAREESPWTHETADRQVKDQMQVTRDMKSGKRKSRW